MKLNAIVCATLLALTGVTHAATTGTYISAGLGGSKYLDYDNKWFDTVSGRAAVGYNFTENFGAELGVASYGTLNKKLEGFKFEHKLRTIDLIGKAYLPVMENKANIYGLAGVAYVMQHVEAKFDGEKETMKVKKYRPVVGLGADYAVTPNVKLGAEFTHLHKKDTIPSINTVMATVTYSFN